MTDTTKMVDITPAIDTRIYSPHVQELKGIFENLSRQIAEIGAAEPAAKIDAEHKLAIALTAQLPRIRKAMGEVLADDFLLMVKGLRRPGERA